MGGCHTTSTSVMAFRAHGHHRQGPENRRAGCASGSSSSRPTPRARCMPGTQKSPGLARLALRDTPQHSPVPRRHSSSPALSVPPQRTHSPYRSDRGGDGICHAPASRHFLQTTPRSWKKAVAPVLRIDRNAPLRTNGKAGWIALLIGWRWVERGHLDW